MGIIARQTIKGSIYSYLGAFIGFVNVGLIMPQIFSTAEIGLTNLLISLAAIFGQFGSMGFMNVTIKIFPFFRNHEKKHNGFLFLMLAAGTLGFMICAAGYYLWKPHLIAQNIEKSPLFAEYVYLLLPLLFVSVFHLLMDSYNRILFNASFGIFVKEFLLRILNLIGIGLFYFNVFDFHAFILFYTIAYGVPLALISLLLLFKHEISFKPSFSFLDKKLVKSIFSVAGFGLISGFSGIAVFQIDRYLVNHYCDLSATGVYSTAFFFGTMILLPARALIKIASSVIAESIKSDKWENIKDIYKRSTHNLLLLGVFTFLIIWGNIDNIMSFLPPEFETGRLVVLFISIAFLFQSFSAISGVIIQYSNYYRQHSLIMIVLILTIVGFNILLLPDMGIKGAALASLFSFIIYAVIQVSYVKLKFGFQPFKLKHLVILIIGGISYFISSLIPQFDWIILDILIRSAILSLLFIVPVLLLGYSEETTKLLRKLAKRIHKS